MSVGVCVINRNGIAMAADSAGTFTGNKMFYNTVNKLFPLSSQNVCGVITYGTLSICNVSIEQIMKEFSSYLDHQEEMKDFFEIIPHFQKFIKQNNHYYKFDVDETSFCHTLIMDLVAEWGAKIQAEIDADDVENKIDTIISELEAFVARTGKAHNFDVSQHIKLTYQNFYDQEITRIIPKLSSFTAQKQRLWDSICSYFNLLLGSESKTGLFFAGYGIEDAHPKYIEITLRNIIGEEIKFTEKDKCSESKNYAEIKPLAQEDIIYTFCKGVSSDFISTLPDKAAAYVKEKIDALPDTFTAEQKEELRNAMSDSKARMSKAIGDISRQKHINPLLESVKLITLSEMAFLAENLVNITSLKRTYALDGNQQTVGGPTDVAILSKGDGFVWIKQKTNLHN